MPTVGSHEAKTTLPNLIERVRKGETITITKRGVPVAELRPVCERQGTDLQRVTAEMLADRKGRTLGDLTLREAVAQARAR
ncbi:MAG: hypothetical protein GHCLOJNM_03544 [bacterium]|nr:hypothetical protein [bacterium]